MSQDSTRQEHEKPDSVPSGVVPGEVADDAAASDDPSADEMDAAGAEQFAAPLTLETLDEETLAELLEKAGERDLFLEELRRTHAEFENYQKRTRRERGENERQVVRNFIAELLPVQDNFERALAEETASNLESFREGIVMIQQMLVTLLADHGASVVDAEGQPFSPQFHEAVSQVEVDDPAQDGVVVALVQKGYSQGDVVIRPARVVVGKKRAAVATDTSRDVDESAPSSDVDESAPSSDVDESAPSS